MARLFLQCARITGITPEGRDEFDVDTFLAMPGRFLSGQSEGAQISFLRNEAIGLSLPPSCSAPSEIIPLGPAFAFDRAALT